MSRKPSAGLSYWIGYALRTRLVGRFPDRLLKVNDEWCLVEVKNWYVTEKQKHISKLKYIDKHGKLKRTHNHYYQVQTALLVSGMKKCYFVVHGAESSIEFIEFDNAFCTTISEKTRQFYEEMLKPLGW